MAARALARVLACTLASTALATASVAQEAAKPAEPAELPPLEVTAKAGQKKSPAKKSQAKAAPKAAPQPAAVQGPVEQPRYTGVTNGASTVENYVATDSAVGTKTDTPLKETPQSISVIGKEQIRDQGAQTVQEATRYTPGVFADPYGFDSRGDSTIIRGIPGSYFVDGLRQTYGYSQTTVPVEPYALERIEVLRGPASMLYGQAPTGGIINGASKLPSEIPYREIGIEYGSFDFKQVKFDATGALTEDGKWLYRVVGLGRDSETEVDYVDNDRLMLAPSLTYRPTNDTSITVLGHFRKDNSGSTQQFMPAEGTLFDNTVTGDRLPRSTFTGEPGDHYDTESQAVSAFIDHKFDNGLRLHHASRYTHTENDYDSTYAAILTPARMAVIDGALGALGLPPGTLVGDNAPFLNADRTEVARARTVTFSDTEIFNTDTNLTGTFLTGPVAHKVTGGVDYMRYRSDFMTGGTLVDNLLTTSSVNPLVQPAFPLFGVIPFQSPFNLYDPQYGQTPYLVSFTDGIVSPDAIPFTVRPTETQTQTGLYIQDQLKLGSWIAVLGVRQDWLTVEEKGSGEETDTATTWRAALMYNFDFGLTPYASYSTSFSPLPGQPVADDIYAPASAWRPAGPIEGEQIEIGFKYQPRGAPFMINAAAYELTDKNQIVQPDVLFSAVQGADVKVRGFEIEVIGKVTPELKVIGAYSYTDAKYDKYPELFPFPTGISDFMEGKRVDGIPQHLASLWAVYSVLDGQLKGLSFGGGVRYVGGSESWGRDIATGQELHIETSSFTLFDAMVAYETPDWRWQLNASNLEDEYVITSCAAYRGDCFIGQGRTIITGFTYKF